MHLLDALLLLPVISDARSIHPLQRRISNGPNINWDAALSKAQIFVAQLSTSEKVNMVTGGFDVGPCVGNIGPIERLSFRGLCFADGPAGVNRADLASVFPAGISTAATWDTELIHQRGLAMGAEFRAKGVNVMLGPAVGPVGRHPLGGRNWEGFGPDPYLAGASIAATVRGVQENGAQTCSKHFIGNEQETQRGTTVSNGVEMQGVSSNIDDRTLHELYLWPFAEAIRAGTTSIMCSYNRVNQTYACENSDLLNWTLKKELGFRGYVVSDWWATHSTAPSANSGLDVEMPGRMTNISNFFPSITPFFDNALLDTVNNGGVSTSRLDDMATRVLTPYFLLGQDTSYPTVDPSTFAALASSEFGLPQMLQTGYPFNMIEGRDVRADHAYLIRKIGSAGTVLLKNVDNTLPVQSPRNIAVFGDDAADQTDSGGWNSGTGYIGGGSGSGRLESPVSPLEAIKARARQNGARVKYNTNNSVIIAGDFKHIYPLPDICLVFLKSWASESADRVSFDLDHDANAVVNSVASWCAKTVVVTHSAGVNTMPWSSHPNVKAILAAHYPGEQAGNSIVDVLWGDVNPSGHLPYTIPKSEQDYAGLEIVNLTGATDPNAWQADFEEGPMIDYRHFDSKNITPLYEFGFGLSYTTFELSSSLSVRALQDSLSALPDPARGIEIGGPPELWDNILEATTSVSNTGSRAGDAVPQLYVSFPSSAREGTPMKVLRGFQKVGLQPGESKEVAFSLRRRDLSFWDVVAQQWMIPDGEFVFRVGFSSRDLRAEWTYTVRS